MDEAQKIHEDGFIFVKNRKIRCPVITACCFLLTSLETRCGVHPSSFRTSAIQTIFKVPSICIIMRIISENDDRISRFACVRPSTVSTTRRRRSSAWHLRHNHRVSAGNTSAPNGTSCTTHPQYFAQRTPTCNCAAYHANVLIRRPLVA